MKEQHMLSEIAENSNPVQESESRRKNANESTAIEGERNFTNQESQPTGEQNRTMPIEQQGYQQRIIRNSLNPVQQGDGSVQ